MADALYYISYVYTYWLFPTICCSPDLGKPLKTKPNATFTLLSIIIEPENILESQNLEIEDFHSI